ncbi:hypothetical protein [Paludisphaera borealis]|uniref:hypothetical protein n=1 Tax=Paludisphaera borealis TaxID=1387353 RepID=UPI0011AB780D|nr:hypothetical protein [Paludisphaera borealis]
MVLDFSLLPLRVLRGENMSFFDPMFRLHIFELVAVGERPLKIRVFPTVPGCRRFGFVRAENAPWRPFDHPLDAARADWVRSRRKYPIPASAGFPNVLTDLGSFAWKSPVAILVVGGAR